MKTYHFRLASVARVRLLEERIARDRFMYALKDLRRAQNMKSEAEDALAAHEIPLDAARIGDFQWVRDQAERLSESIQVCEIKVLGAESKCIETRRAWDEANKRSRVLVRLEDKARTRWRDQMLREEAAELDDLTNSRFILGGGL